MGKIYDAIRELEAEYEEENGVYLNFDYVEIPTFIEMLELYSNDSQAIIYSYLMNSNDFLEIDFYEESYNDGIFQIVKFEKKNVEYDDVISNTRDIVESIAAGNRISDFNDYYWKKSEILDLESIKRIGLNDDNFENYRKATQYNPTLHLKLVDENEDLKKRLNSLRENMTDTAFLDLKEELEKVKQLNKIQEQHIADLQSSRLSVSPNDTNLPSRTANNASKIISALASELLGMDLTRPYSDETNGKIREAIEKQGNKLGNDKIADWLKLAHDQSK
nr:hypothetical protein [Moraxella osloensis]